MDILNFDNGRFVIDEFGNIRIHGCAMHNNHLPDLENLRSNLTSMITRLDIDVFTLKEQLNEMKMREKAIQYILYENKINCNEESINEAIKNIKESEKLLKKLDDNQALINIDRRI